MSEFDDADLIRHVLGDASPQLARAIEEAARQDPELAAKLEVMGYATGDVAPLPAPLPQPARWLGRHPVLKQLAIHAAVFAAGTAAGWTISAAYFQPAGSPASQ